MKLEIFKLPAAREEWHWSIRTDADKTICTNINPHANEAEALAELKAITAFLTKEFSVTVGHGTETQNDERGS